jgi:ribonuclease HI
MRRRIGVDIASGGASFEFAYPIDPDCTNNQAEYLVILKGIKLLREVKADTVEKFRESQLVISQLLGTYECNNEDLLDYCEES